MKKLSLLTLLAATQIAASAVEIPIKQDTTKKTRYSLFITGRVDAAFYTDSYTNVESRDGLQYMMPARPKYDPITGEDLNYVGKLRFNIASTRIGIGTKITFNEKTSIDALIETDFMGVSANIMQSLRLRHAYLRLNLGRSSILVGQTNHLAMVDQIAPPTVTYAAGYPINLQARPIQIQFSQQLGIVNLAAAAAMYTSDIKDMQALAMTPDFSVRVTVGDFNRNVIGLVGGFKSIMPQLTSYVSDKQERMNSFYAALFGRVTMGKGYAIRAYAIYGGDLSALGLTGGFAPLLDHAGYAPTNTVSAWIDFATPRFAGFEFGIFGGYQQNLGTMTDIDLGGMVMAGTTTGLQNFWRVAPRVWYHFKMLSFGFEYMYSQSLWAHQWNDRYLSTMNLPATRNNRYTLLARFTF